MISKSDRAALPLAAASLRLRKKPSRLRKSPPDTLQPSFRPQPLVRWPGGGGRGSGPHVLLICPPCCHRFADRSAALVGHQPVTNVDELRRSRRIIGLSRPPRMSGS